MASPKEELENKIERGAIMNSDLINDWFRFLRDINVSPPEFPNSMSIEAWCPIGTTDTVRVQQKRPLLRRLLNSLEQGTYDERHYPKAWIQRRSFQKLTANAAHSNSLQHWILDHMNGYDEHFLLDLRPNLRQELEAQYNRITKHESELYFSSISLFEKITMLEHELNKRKRRNLTNRTSKTRERSSLLNRYESRIIEPQKEIWSQIEGTRITLYEYMKNLVLDIDSNSLVGFKELSELPSIDGILRILNGIPDLTDTDVLQTLDYQQIETSIHSEMESYVQKLSQSLEIEPSTIGLDYTLGNEPAQPMNVQVNINTSGKQTNVMQNTSINGTPDTDSEIE